jgi:hypothetical protein
LGALGGEFLDAAANPEIETLIQRLAQQHADSGFDALSEYLTEPQLASLESAPQLQPALMGQAVQNATFQSLEDLFPGRFLNFTNVPYDFVDTATGELYELTTYGQAAGHASNTATLILYGLQ